MDDNTSIITPKLQNHLKNYNCKSILKTTIPILIAFFLPDGLPLAEKLMKNVSNNNIFRIHDIILAVSLEKFQGSSQISSSHHLSLVNR